MRVIERGSVFTMSIGVIIALVASLLVIVAFGTWPALIAGIAVFTIWYAVRRARRHLRRTRANGGDSGSHDVSSPSSSSEHGPSFSGAGGAFGGAGASGLWAFVFDSDGGAHGGNGGHGAVTHDR